MMVHPDRRGLLWRGVAAGSPLERVLALAVFYGAGGALCLLSLVLPAWAEREDSLVLVVGISAAAVSVVLAVAARRAPYGICYALVLLGSLLIALLVYAGQGGPGSATYGGFYVFVGVYSFLFFRVRVAVLQIAFAMGCQIVALVAAGQGASAWAQLAVSFGIMIATSTLVGLLSARMHTLAATDGLTGLPNRRALDAELDHRLRQDRRRSSLAVLGLDLDGFKGYNDELGHAAGDRLLVAVASGWTALLRSQDVLARTGGDEFVALLPDCDEQRATQVASRLVAAVPPPVSACIGLVIVDLDGTRRLEKDTILDEVDRALYEGKATRNGSVVVGRLPSVGAGAERIASGGDRLDLDLDGAAP
jgi:diguanylate cyclase (GGDEF)-like protein